MAYPSQPWRDALQPASFGGAPFRVEVDSQAGGRNLANHQFPHRDVPWAEDMGRKGRRWPVAAYVIGPDYRSARDALIAACEREGPQTLVHPSLGQVQAACENYVATERREQGGYCVFELSFLEAGSQPGAAVTADTQSRSTAAATQSDAASATSLNAATAPRSDTVGVGSDAVAAQEIHAIPTTTPLGIGIGRN